MPRATYEDFLNAPFVGRKLADNADAQEIFAILSDEETIARAIELSKSGEPALLAAVAKVEAYIESRGKNSTFPLTLVRNCQLVGIMQKVILEPLGYFPSVDKPMPTRYFRSAMTYVPA